MPDVPLAGITGFTIDGTPYMLVADATWSPNKWKRETLIGLDQVHGFSELPTAGFMEATLRDADDLVVGDFNDMRSVEVMMTLANGKVVGGSNMWHVQTLEVKAAEATFVVRFEGLSVDEN
jgi:hypothetical protein